ncbi:Thaumatin-like protein 1a [Zea mays]|uniref:Thaumatin-like protein 1 n=2 Tax=Zea mays TaxID=4577 RepID=C4JB74_MAIZE|nr:putative thaumatin domain family protein isoform X2 [Zea mays]ACR38424.1 unknown [Zea mays]PWZ45306.1 Thaumatin-like protein 1a [Zea mays]|eukprot:XP_008661346.1 putative thaumatin domain family protein isoform X2 [Zea mays]
MAVAHLLLQLSAGVNGASRNRMLIPAILSILQLIHLAGVDGAASFRFTNACQHPVWVGALHGASSPPLASSGFYLARSATSRLDAPSSGTWSGTFWARTGCAVDSATGRFSCATADCGTGDVACQGRGPAPPVSLVEVTLAAPGSGGQDFYDVSLVDGFNVPVRVAPSGGGGDCRPAACAGDVNAMCPADLRVVASSGSGGVVACKSACSAYGSARYCCTGQYGTPATCRPTNYSQVFKSACPSAYSYAYDDTSSTFTCSGASSYDVTFCPGTGS